MRIHQTPHPYNPNSTHVLNSFDGPVKDIVVKNPRLLAKIKAKDYDRLGKDDAHTLGDGTVVTRRSYLCRLGAGKDFVANITCVNRPMTFKDFAVSVLEGNMSGPNWTKNPAETDLQLWYRTYICSLDEEETDFFLMIPLDTALTIPVPLNSQ